MHHVISWSSGKDSTATVILFKQHLSELTDPGDKITIIFSEVMFDKKRHISGENPDIIEFVYKTKELFDEWGFETVILHSDKDYLDCFYHRLTRSPDPERIGRPYGFCISGMCSVKRDCKLKPINDWMKAHSDEEMTVYEGIASDEKPRLISLHKKENHISLLEKYGLTEADARKLCEQYGLLSPQYSLDGQTRDGCWFCPNAKLAEHKAIAEKMPKAWKKYVALENTPDLAYPKWNPYSKETLHQRDEMIRKGYYQLSLSNY